MYNGSLSNIVPEIVRSIRPRNFDTLGQNVNPALWEIGIVNFANTNDFVDLYIAKSDDLSTIKNAVNRKHFGIIKRAICIAFMVNEILKGQHLKDGIGNIGNEGFYILTQPSETSFTLEYAGFERDGGFHNALKDIVVATARLEVEGITSQWVTRLSTIVGQNHASISFNCISTKEGYRAIKSALVNLYSE